VGRNAAMSVLEKLPSDIEVARKISSRAALRLLGFLIKR
jgi:hypothetical protein